MWQIKQNLSTFLTIYGFSGTNLLILAGLIGILIVFLFIFIRYFLIFLLCWFERKFRNRHFEIWLNLAEKISLPIALLNGLFFSSVFLHLPQKISNLIDTVYLIVSVVYIINLVRIGIADAIKVYLKTRGNVSDEAIKTVINFTNVTSTIILWILAILIFLQLSQVDTQALLSGLGIASIIVAFSFQNILRDIFAFFSIYIDRSFSVGDYIVFDKYEGTIKEIRLRTTKIQALKGHDIIISNYQLINGVIENYNRLRRRRVVLNFRVDHNLNPTASEKLLVELKNIFNSLDLENKVELSSLTLDEISNYGLVFKIAYYFIGSNYNEHLAIKEKINLEILKVLIQNKVKLEQIPIISNQAITSS